MTEREHRLRARIDSLLADRSRLQEECARLTDELADAREVHARARNTTTKRARRKRGLPPLDARHGTVNAYSNYGCRCDECRAAWAGYILERNHRLGLRRPMAVYLAELAEAPPPPHGTESRYTSGCRCDECRIASNAARRQRNAADPERARAVWREQARRKRERQAAA